MSRIGSYFKKALTMPPHVVVARAAAVLRFRLRRLWTRWRDARLPTYRTPRLSGALARYVAAPPPAALEAQRATILDLANLYCDHYFDLLGSGWVQVRHGMTCRGLEGQRYTPPAAAVDAVTPANRAYARRVRALIPDDYVPIDWHLDFKSGFRWSALTPASAITYGDQVGADVKVPWELARAQHLPTLAYAYALTHDERYAQEFRSQILDFIASSPPRFGVNWVVAMDVGIRAANWLLAYDLFRAFGAQFDADFERELLRSIDQHAHHIRHHLEWSPTLRSNHYLSDIVGLLFCAAYLPRTPETDAWLRFAAQELCAEFALQFNPDGSNFEASTSYHRLSAELLLYSVALLLALPPDKRALADAGDTQGALKADWFWQRLQKMATFTLHITRPDGRIPQFGDTDSGRLFKLHPAYQKMTVAAAKKTYLHLADYAALPDDAAYYDEDILDHRPLVAAANGLFPRADFRAFAGDCLDEYIVAGLARSAPPASSEGALMRADRLALQTPSAHFSDSQADKEITPPADAQSTRLQFPGARSLRAGLRLHAYPDFGLYIFRSPRLYLAVRCGSLGQRGNGGHAHSDQLSIELWVDDQPQIVDPGTYIYTPLPAQRNRYRSAAVHFAPRFAAEPADLSLLFRMPDVFRAQCLYAGVAGFAGTHSAYGTPITRLIRILDDALEIYDTPGTHTQPAAVPHSNGYGKLLAKHAPSAARE